MCPETGTTSYILAIGSGERLLCPSNRSGQQILCLSIWVRERLVYPSNRVRTVNPVSVRVRVMVSASLSSAAVPVSKR